MLSILLAIERKRGQSLPKVGVCVVALVLCVNVYIYAERRKLPLHSPKECCFLAKNCCSALLVSFSKDRLLFISVHWRCQSSSTCNENVQKGLKRKYTLYEDVLCAFVYLQ